MTQQMSKLTIKALGQLRRQGLSVPEWSKIHGFNVRAVRAVLYGQNKRNYGTSHRIAVALGMKEGTD